MSTQRGVAVITGVAGLDIVAIIVTSGGGDAQVGDEHFQSANHTRDADFKWLKSGNGDDVASLITDAKQTLSITVLPYAAAVADVGDVAANLCQASGAKVTISDSDGTVIDGDYLLISSKLNLTNDGFGLVDMELTKWDDNDLTVIPT